MISTLYNFHLAAKATSSINVKKDLLREYAAAHGDSFRRMLLAVYNPRVNYYITALDEPAGFRPSVFVSLELIEDVLRGASTRASTRASTPAGTRASLRVLCEGADCSVYEALKLVIARDLQCGLNVSTINQVLGDVIPESAYMRCDLPKNVNLSEWPWNYGVPSQEKADGQFVNINNHAGGGVELLTREGGLMPIENFRELEHEVTAMLNPGTQTHAELVVHENGAALERKVSNGIIAHLIRGDGTLAPNQRVIAMAWDQIPLEEAKPRNKYRVEYQRRWNSLCEQVRTWQGGSAPALRLIPHRTVYSLAEAHAHYVEMLGLGKEGTIVKHPMGIWEDATSRNCIKFKLKVAVELRVKRLNPPNKSEGKNKDTFGSIACESEDGLLEVNVQGIADKERRRLWEMRESLPGAVITAEFNDVMEPKKAGDKHSLYLPTYVELRTDKTEADTLERIRAQFESAVRGSVVPQPASV